MKMKWRNETNMAADNEEEEESWKPNEKYEREMA